jgi:hypothetical protein
MAPTARRVAALLPLMFAAAAVFAAPAIADSTEYFPIPRRIIAAPCDAEQYLAGARDTSPVYFDRYMRDKSNRPAGVQQSAVDRIHWFFSLDPAARRQYSEETATNVYYEQVPRTGATGQHLLQQQRCRRESHRSLHPLPAATWQCGTGPVAEFEPDILTEGLDVAGTQAWVLPNPSGLNIGFRSTSSLTRMASYIKLFRRLSWSPRTT